MEGYGSSRERSPTPTSAVTGGDDDGARRGKERESNNINMSDGKIVKITVQQQNTKDVTFNVKRNAPLGKLMFNYCREMGLNATAFKFTYLGKQVLDDKTPLDFQMEDVDVIDCWSDMWGGCRGGGGGNGGAI